MTAVFSDCDWLSRERTAVVGNPHRRIEHPFHDQGLLWEAGSCTRHTSQSHRTPIMLGGLILIAGGLISNRDEGHFRQSARAVRNVSLSACAVRNVSASTAVCSHFDESQGHSITKRRVPNKGTSATRAVAWGSVGRLIDPQISNST